ncbi:MAG: hypothetical protein NTZ74_01130 [Chloroflexi bacterium]|nr:hypothetical protein [Chloroflexota bacterium]
MFRTDRDTFQTLPCRFVILLSCLIIILGTPSLVQDLAISPHHGDVTSNIYNTDETVHQEDIAHAESLPVLTPLSSYGDAPAEILQEQVQAFFPNVDPPKI